MAISEPRYYMFYMSTDVMGDDCKACVLDCVKDPFTPTEPYRTIFGGYSMRYICETMEFMETNHWKIVPKKECVW